MDIYWIKDKRRGGPSTVPDVISLLQAGELTPDSLGWHSGCKEWCPLRELPALADFLNKPAPSEEEPPPLPPLPAAEDSKTEQNEAQATEVKPTEGKSESPGQLRLYLPNPAARVLARFVDYGLYAMLYGGIIAVQGLPYSASLLPQVNPLLWLPLIVLEAGILSAWGTTPGKALLGIRVTTFGEVPRLSFMRALLRSAMVFTLGMGLMLPQLLPVMLLFQFWMLRRRGITPWDARSSTLPTQKEPASPSRYVLAVISLYVSLVVFYSCLQPWVPGMIDDIARQNPEMAQTLRSFMPAEKPSPAAPVQSPAPASPSPATLPQDSSLPGM